MIAKMLQRKTAAAGGGSWTPASIASIYGWYKADSTSTSTNGASVATWYDSSGNGNNLTQSDSTKQPIYRATDTSGLPALEGNNSTTAMVNTAFDASNGCMYVVMRPYGTTQLYGGGFQFGTTGSLAEIANQLISSTEFHFRYNGGSDNGRFTAANGNVIFKIARTGTTAKVKTSVTSETSFSVAYTWQGFRLFENYYGSLGCRIAEVIVCTAELSSADEALLNSYLMGKYGNQDPYFDKVSVLLHMNGSNGSTTFTDSSSNALTVTPNGNAQISTAQTKFGGASAYFDGVGDSLFASSSTLFSFSGDFTFEGWFYFSQVNQYNGATILVSMNVLNAFQLGTEGNNIRLRFNGTLLIDYANTASNLLNKWTHIAVTRKDSTVTLWVNGTSVSSSTSTASTSVSSISIGQQVNNAAYFHYLNGYIDDLRITKGVARYTANFTAPTAAFPDS